MQTRKEQTHTHTRKHALHVRKQRAPQRAERALHSERAKERRDERACAFTLTCVCVCVCVSVSASASIQKAKTPTPLLTLLSGERQIRRQPAAANHESAAAYATLPPLLPATAAHAMHKNKKEESKAKKETAAAVVVVAVAEAAAAALPKSNAHFLFLLCLFLTRLRFSCRLLWILTSLCFLLLLLLIFLISRNGIYFEARHDD